MFTSPKFLAGLLGGVALGAAGSTLYLFSDKERSLELRKKLVTAIRDMADRAIENIENLEKVAEDFKNAVESEEETTTTKSSRAGGRAKTEEPAVN